MIKCGYLPGEQPYTRYLRGMEPDALTAWVPIGDISPVGGGLMYLEDSVPLGTEIEDKFNVLNRDLPDEDRLDAFNVNVGGVWAR